MFLPYAVFVLMGLLSCSGCSQSSPKVEEGYITTSDNVRLYYKKVGSASPTIILPARLYAFEDFRRLGERYTLISYDMRNRGRSDPVTDDSKITIEADVEDLEAVRRHFGVEKFTPVGYSYLGLMVAMYAMAHPEHVDRIIQLGPVPLKYSTPYQPQFAAPDWESSLDSAGLGRLRKLREENYHATHPQEYCKEEWQVTRFSLVGDPSKVDRLPRNICDMQNEWPVNLNRHFQLHFGESVQKLDIPREEVKRIIAPTLTIHGSKDRNAPYGAGREWVYLLPHARLLTVEGAAHQAFAEAPEIVFPAIETFLKGDWPPNSEEVTTDPRKTDGDEREKIEP